MKFFEIHNHLVSRRLMRQKQISVIDNYDVDFFLDLIDFSFFFFVSIAILSLFS